MANACADCGGVGYGTIDEEFGWRKGPACPRCTKRFEKSQAGVKEEDRHAFGPQIIPSAVSKRGDSVAFVDGPPDVESSEEEFDPGVVDTGTEPGVPATTIEEALAAAAAERQE